MSLKLKPTKCRSISISSGTSSEVFFKINDNVVPTVKSKPEKFLGTFITFYGKTSETFNLIESKIKSILSNIDNTEIRPEYKLQIWTRYAIPSLRYIMTVHSLTDTQLQQLDSLHHRYLKSWLRLPPSATNAVIHHKAGLNIQSLSNLYFESKTMSYAASYFNGDSCVKWALTSKLKRESQWTTKMKNNGTVHSHEILENILETTENHSWKSVKPLVKKSVKEEVQERWKQHIEPLKQQGNLLKLAEEMNADLDWKSSAYNLPRGVLSFAIRASIDVLPNPTNLCLWGKKTNDKCLLCCGRGSLLHVLSGCSTSLDQGRYTYRHNLVLKHLVTFLKDKIKEQDLKLQLFADLHGSTIEGGTIPSLVLPTSEKPDICVYDSENQSISIIELTVPFDCNIDKARKYKCDKYEVLVLKIVVSNATSFVLK